MIHSLNGLLAEKEGNLFAVEINGISFAVKSSANAIKNLPPVGEKIKVFTYLHVREDALELYGFLDKKELTFFKLLIGISGIGPKSALNILGIEKVEKLQAAISEGRSELLSRASGIGKKTAERIILELRNKLAQSGSENIVGVMESDNDIIEALSNLGYSRSQAREALSKIDGKTVKMEERIKSALRLLKNG